MADPQGIATYPGVMHLLDASVTIAHGIAPSVAQLTVAPQAALPNETGTLSFTFGPTVVLFPNCKIDHGDVERTARGEIVRLSILDRRWRWRFGEISGSYNVRRDDYSLQQGEIGSIDTEQTPQQLATLCLEAMGESGFDVADLPNDTRPSVEWDATVPAEALATLCDQLACRVVLQLDDRVVIRQVGVGATLTQSDTMQYSTTVNLPERPDTIAVLGGANRYQVDFRLEAVGLTGDDSENSDSLQPIDQLGYLPASGWSRIDLPYFHQVGTASRTVARKSVFKYYRIKTPVIVPGYSGANGNVIDRLEQILPVEDEQIALAGENSQLASQPAVVFGVWHPDGLRPANSVQTLTPLEELPSAAGSLGPVYRRGFKIDVARGLVIFDEPVYRNVHASASGGSGFEVVIGPADLVLRVACSVRDPESLSLDRYSRQRGTGGNSGTAPRFLRHDEIVRTHTPQYSPNYALAGVETNAAEVDLMADHYLDAAEAEYEITGPVTATYPGLLPVEIDGAIRQVGFQVGGSGATTTVARNHESPRHGRGYKSIRRMERQRSIEALVDRFSPRNLARSLKTNARTKPRP